MCREDILLIRKFNTCIMDVSIITEFICNNGKNKY